MARNESHLGQFSLVLQSFVENLTEGQRDDFGFSTLEDFQTIVLDIQGRQGSERKMRNLARLSCFIEAMDQYGKVIEVFVNASEIVAFIWGPAKFLLQIASAYAEAFDALLDAYQHIGENLPLLSQYQALFQRNPHMQIVLKLIYNDILEFHMKAMKYFRRRTWRQLFHATWKTFQSEFSGILANIHRHGRLIESQASLVEFEQLFNQMEMGRVAAETEFQRRKEEDEMRRRIAVRTWLSAANTDIDQEKGVNIREQYPGSGSWLLERSQIQNWLNSEVCSNPLLWLHGIPGAGKTVLASLLIEQLQKQSLTQPATLAFFYFKHKDDQRSSFVSAARAMLTQILKQNDDLLGYIFEEASLSGETVLNSSSLAKELLETTLKSSEKVYIVLDGLDECDSNEKRLIISWFQSAIIDLPDAELGSIRCLFVSQNDGDIGKLLAKVPTLQINSENTKADIQAYSIAWATKIQDKFNLLDNKKEEVLTAVVDRSNGMFLFAKLVMENLFNQTKRENLTKELEPDVFPHGLQDAYARIADRILGDPVTKEDVQQLLGWLVCAKRPLKWREIQGAVSINLEAKDVDIEERKLRVESKVLCGSLVEQRSDGSVELVHLTARFFLVDQKYVNLGSEAFNLARLCLGYLNFPCFQRTTTDSEIKEFVIKGYYVFLEYAALYWVDHLQECVFENKPQELIISFQTVIHEFLHNFWADVERQRAPPSKELGTKLSKFGIYKFHNQLTKAATIWEKLQKTYGIENNAFESLVLVEQILKVREVIERNFAPSNSSIGQESSVIAYYGPDLFKCRRISCEHFTTGFLTKEARDQHFKRHTRSFRCTEPGCPFELLGFSSVRELNRHLTHSHQIRELEETKFPITQEPTDINITSAIRTGSILEVERWLEQFSEASTKLPNSKSREVLDVAIKKGDEVIFELIMDGMPEIQTSTISRLFSSALSMSYDSIALMLLAHPQADPFDLSSSNAESPMAVAVRLGRSDILERFGDWENINWNRNVRVKVSAFPNRKDIMSLLSIAAREGHLEIVKMLLKKTCDSIESTNSGNRTSLSFAAENGHVEIVKLLVHMGADISSKADDDRTALSFAAENGHFDVVKLLVDMGADTSSRADYGYTTLSIAAENGHFDVVKLLVDTGADISSKTNSGRTALSLAAENGHFNVAKLLVDTGADISSKTDSRRTALSLAAENGHFDVVKLLVDMGADIHSKTLYPAYTALSLAAQNGHFDVVKLLVEMGADISSKIDSGHTTLSLAAVNGHFDIVKLLVDIGADISSKTDGGRTALSLAAKNGYFDIVELLLDSGVDINSKDSNESTALSLAAADGRVRVVQLLLDMDADMNSTNINGWTPFFWSVANRHLEIAKLLADRTGVDIEARDSEGHSAFSWAAANGVVEVVKLLITMDNINIDSKDVHGRTPFAWAAANGKSVIVQLLVDRDDIDINSEDNNGRTPFSWAAGNGHIKVIELLADKNNVDIDSQDHNGRTPLWSAARNGHVKIVELLLKKDNVDPDSKDSNGRTALWWAAGNGHFNIVKLLAEKDGVELDCKDSTCRTPESWAAENKHLEVSDWLQEKARAGR